MKKAKYSEKDTKGRLYLIAPNVTGAAMVAPKTNVLVGGRSKKESRAAVFLAP